MIYDYFIYYSYTIDNIINEDSLILPLCFKADNKSFDKVKEILEKIEILL